VVKRTPRPVVLPGMGVAIPLDQRHLPTLNGPYDAERRPAFDPFCCRVAKEVAGLATSPGGFDALMFAAGIGEHSAPSGRRSAPTCNDSKQPPIPTTPRLR
jgi:Acetate kinase